MQPMFPQLEPPNMLNTMKDVGWPIIIVIASLLGSIIAAMILGTTQVIGFDWLVLILVGIMLGITVFCIWYSLRTRQRFQERYNKDIADIKSDVLAFKNDIRSMREEEADHWNEWAISFSQAINKEQKERAEELKRQCMEAISDAELRLDVSVKNAQSIFSGAVESQRIAVDLYGQQLIQALKRMEALEERLRKELTPDTTDQSSEVEIPPA